MTRMLAALGALVVLAVPAAAAAQGSTTNAPPGNSAIDEYLETVPAAGGHGIPRRPQDGGATLTATQRDRLEQLGADGRRLAAIVESTAPAPTRNKQRPETKTSAVALPDAKGRSPIGAVLGAAQGDGGMGLLLPAIMLASLLAAVTLVLLRRRSPS